MTDACPLDMIYDTKKIYIFFFSKLFLFEFIFIIDYFDNSCLNFNCIDVLQLFNHVFAFAKEEGKQEGRTV